MAPRFGTDRLCTARAVEMSTARLSVATILFIFICSRALSAQLGPLPPQQALKRGEEVFNTTCTGACHGNQGLEGSGAPRLASRGLDGEYIESTIMYGKPKTAMPAWGQKLPIADLLAVITYVKDLNGISAIAPRAAADSLSGEAERGRQLFFDREGGMTRCSTCHSVASKGLNIARLHNIPTDVASLRNISTPRVSTATVGKDRFPALVVMQAYGETRVYDLSTVPPPLRRFRDEEVQLSGGNTWSHRSVLEAYSDDELQSILAFLRGLKPAQP